MTTSIYPNLRAATLAMAYDIGCINRNRTEDQVLASLDLFLTGRAVSLSYDLADIDLWLGRLSKEALDTVCCGEEVERVEILKTAPPGTGPLLADIFDYAL